MINSLVVKKALSIIANSGVNKYALSIDGKPINIEGAHIITNKSLTQSLTDDQKASFIEFDTTSDKGAIHVWIWSNTHPQYEAIMEDTEFNFWEGVFEVHPQKGMRYVSSIYPKIKDI